MTCRIENSNNLNYFGVNYSAYRTIGLDGSNRAGGSINTIINSGLYQESMLNLAKDEGIDTSRTKSMPWR